MWTKASIKNWEKNLNNIGGIVSIARKAGAVIVGQDNLIGYDKKMYLIVMDELAGKSLQREMQHLSKTREIPLVIVKDLQSYVKIENCKVIGIKNKELSEKVFAEIKGE